MWGGYAGGLPAIISLLLVICAVLFCCSSSSTSQWLPSEPVRYNIELWRRGRNREWPGMATRKTLLWALQFVVMGNISVLKFDFSFRRRSWAEVTAAGFKGNGQGGKYLARLWFLHSSPWHLLCLSQYSSGRAWGRRNSCTVALPGLWPETVLPLLKEKHDHVFVGTGFSKLLLVPPVPWATLKPEGRGATNTTYPLLSASTQYRLTFQNLLLGEKKILMKSPCICIQR